MKSILNLFIALFALLVLAAPVQAAEKFTPNADSCFWAIRTANAYIEAGEKLSSRQKMEQKICQDYAKNPDKYRQPEKSAKGKTLREIAGW